MPGLLCITIKRPDRLQFPSGRVDKSDGAVTIQSDGGRENKRYWLDGCTDDIHMSRASSDSAEGGGIDECI